MPIPFRLLATAGACLLIHDPAAGRDFTIRSGEFLGTGLILDATGDTVTIEQGGELTTSDLSAVSASADGVEMLNGGDVTGGGFGFYGKSGNHIINNGSLSGGSAGIYATSSNTITNVGAILGPSGYGITLRNGNQISNSGTISAAVLGIWAADDNTVINSGNIDADVAGIYVEDTNTIGNSGSIRGGTVGISAEDHNTITNAGEIVGESAYGIYATDSNTIQNSGLVSGVFSAIRVQSHNAIVNTMTITATNDGIISCSDNTITNSGSITAGDDGIRACDANTIENAGKIASGDIGLLIDDDNRVTNSGSIISTGNGIDGGSSNAVENSGTISADGNAIVLDSYGIINNRGTLIGDAHAVSFTGIGNRLNVLVGSNVQGQLSLGTDNSVYIDKGLNTVFAYTGDPSVSTGGSPFVDSGSLIAAVDPTGFSAQDEILADLTRGITESVHERSIASSRQRFDRSAQSAAVIPTADPVTPGETSQWISSFGLVREQDGKGPDVGFGTRLGGLVAAVDADLPWGLRIGGFGGAAISTFSTETGSQDIKSSAVYAGAYADTTWRSWAFGFSFAGGMISQHSTRVVLNNMVSGGIEYAEVDDRGLFINPVISVWSNQTGDFGTITPMLTIGYAGMYLPAYTESGSTAALDVGRQFVHVGSLRGEITFTRQLSAIRSGQLDLSGRIGGEGLYSADAGIHAQVIGQPIEIDATRGLQLLGFAGGDINYRMPSGLLLFVSAEAGYGSDGALSAEARAGLAFDL
jgi:hypothetical protein